MRNRYAIPFLLIVFLQTSLIAQQGTLQLLPWPHDVRLGNGKHLLSKDFSIRVSGEFDTRLYKGVASFLDRLDQRTGLFLTHKKAIKGQTGLSSLEIKVKRPGEIRLFEEESYTLSVNEGVIRLESTTDLGALHGLESLLQLLDHREGQYFFPEIQIADQPRFPWRGLMIDVARHYLPLEVLKRNVDAMAAVKLNVFHWHLSDDQGFRVEVKSFPKLHEEASDGLYYTQDEIRELVQYAADRGIRVIPEIDVPGHATAILTAYPEFASKKMNYRIERNKGVFDATLDPTNKETYVFLDKMITELSALFPDPYFHIGGDENKGKHWDESLKVQQFKKEHGFQSNHELQTYFNVQLQQILKKNNKIMMGWDEIFEPKLPKDIVIHSWRGKEAMVNAAKKGYKSVLSKGYYIDLLFDTKTHYEESVLPEDHGLTEQELQHILGGEATMWGELINSTNVDSRIWPRTAAIAERFWSKASVRNFDALKKRLLHTSISLEEHGLTHIKNRDRILRGLWGNHDIDPLRTLSQICSPITARERVGKPYKTYQPFTLFVDACTPDSPATFYVEALVDAYRANSSERTEKKINTLLEGWRLNHTMFIAHDIPPVIRPLVSFSEALDELSGILLSRLERSKKFSDVEQKRMAQLLEKLETPILNVRLAITDDLKVLIENVNKK
ncbi:beta-N-acetylhexosaminidase [Spongiimicrobium salis]|uniref:beta-N-acetylhexosaminidase n=1 Tax=Spongiimicrobium salis TaxID=1667022 RepID=UPI00374D9751